MTEPLLTIDDATREFRVSAKTIRRRLSAGEIDGAYKRPGTRGPEWVMPRSSLARAGFDVRDGATAQGLPEDEGARADYWARRALDAEAALRAASSGVEAPAPRRRGRLPAVVGVAVLVLLALVAGVLLGRSGDDDSGADPTSGRTAAATSLLGSLTGPGDAIGHVGPEAAGALPDGRRAVAIEDLRDARAVRYVLVAGRASARPVVGELQDRTRTVLELGDGIMVFDTARAPGPTDRAEASEDDPVEEDAEPPVEEAPVAEGPGGEASAVPDAGGDPADGPGVEPQTDGPAVTSADGGDTGQVVVEAGESFWSIAEAIAAERGAEVTTTWADLVAANTDRLVEPGNPDLLHVGQTLVVPASR